MRISTKCSIALHCLIFIAECENKTKVTSELLAKSTGCNPAAIRSILNYLQKADIIYINRGIGGAHLKKAPNLVTVWNVYYSLEPDGLEHFIGFHSTSSEKCPIGKNIDKILNKPYEDIGISVKKAMEQITLQQLLENFHQINNADISFSNKKNTGE